MTGLKRFLFAIKQAREELAEETFVTGSFEHGLVEGQIQGLTIAINRLEKHFSEEVVKP